MSLKKIYLYGKGGHSRVVSEILVANHFEIVDIFDDDQDKVSDDSLGVRLRQNRFQNLDHPLIITIGDNSKREQIAHLLKGHVFETAIDRSAIVSTSAVIGDGTVVLHGSIIQAEANIGEHVLVNTGASIDHQCVIGDFAHVSPHATLCGHVEVGEGTHIGAAAVVIPCVTIGKWCKVGAGTVVIRNIPDYCTVVGNPARIIKQEVPDFEAMADG